jgi:transcriptional regulator NrdR family protein
MNCPLCNAWTTQLNTRKRPLKGVTYRRYECGNLHRITTENHVVVRVDPVKRKAGRPKKEIP